MYKPNSKIQKTLQQLYPLPLLPPIDLESYKSNYLTYAKGFTSSQEELDRLELDMTRFVENEGKLASETLNRLLE